jgi:hypothetical protein
MMLDVSLRKIASVLIVNAARHAQLVVTASNLLKIQTPLWNPFLVLVTKIIG